jgi:DNA-binding MarR family transcriptional regulator
MGNSKSILTGCLYFTANSLSRVMTRMANDQFRITGLSPSHAFLMMVLFEDPGIGPKELAKRLDLAPSTVTRFLDYLQNKDLIERISEGKVFKLYPTAKGRELKEPIGSAWRRLHNDYSEILGKENSAALTKAINIASEKLTE